MVRQKRFIRELQSYHDHLVDRFNKGGDYVDSHPDDQKAIRLYNDIIKELAEVEKLLNTYK